MDPERFDALTRGLLDGANRRRVLTDLGSGLAALLAGGRARPVAAQPQTGRRPGRCGPVGQPCKFHQHCCEPLVCFGGYCAASTSPPPNDCTTPAECPQSTTPCQTATCVNGVCGIAVVDLGSITCGIGACQRTVARCSATGQEQPCTPGQPSPEVCNGIDDDCDGEVDEDFPQLGQPCDGNDADTDQEGIYVCDANGGVVCTDF